MEDLEKSAQEFEDDRDPGFTLCDSQVLRSEDQRARSGSGQGVGRLRQFQSNGSQDQLQYEDSEDEDDDLESGAGEELLRSKNSKDWRNLQLQRSSVQRSNASVRSEAPSESSGRRRLSLAFEDENEQTMNMLYDMRVTLKKRAISLFVALRELKSYAQLNRTGFTKAAKKYDKTLDRSLKSAYIDRRVAPAYCFLKSTARNLDESLAKIENLYADLVTDGDIEVARRDLRLHLREHVVWERNTVWREMIGIERKAHAAHIGGLSLLGDDLKKTRLAGDEADSVNTKELKTPVGRIRVPSWAFSSGFFTLAAILVVFVTLLQAPVFETPEQNNCFAMLVFVSLLWATEVFISQILSITLPALI